MASAISILVNDNAVQNVMLLDSLTEYHIFEQKMIKHNKELLTKVTEIELDARYDFRPDKLSYESYGTNFWYPAILVANKLGSILQFKSAYLNKKCLLPNKDVIQKILQYDTNTVQANQI